jgi:drug/metabolite transporter (DMT)-like permease
MGWGTGLLPMLASVLTTFFFALSAVSGSRAVGLLGPVVANVIRLSLATLILALIAFSFGQGFSGPGLVFFLMSGLVGFGLGDVALFHAYERLGSQRTILLAQCGAVPFAALTEWLWLGTRISSVTVFWIVLILTGVSLAVRPRKASALAPGMLWSGLGFGLLAALGQGWGAVLSRKAVLLNQTVGITLDGWTSSFQRIGPGLAVATCFLVWFLLKKRKGETDLLTHTMAAIPCDLGKKRRIAFWCLANSLAGPVMGVGCYQWALAGTASAIVLAVVATTPIVILPLVWCLGEDRPEVVSIAGSLLATGGVIGLLLG